MYINVYILYIDVLFKWLLNLFFSSSSLLGLSPFRSLCLTALLRVHQAPLLQGVVEGRRHHGRWHPLEGKRRFQLEFHFEMKNFQWFLMLFNDFWRSSVKVILRDFERKFKDLRRKFPCVSRTSSQIFRTFQGFTSERRHKGPGAEEWDLAIALEASKGIQKELRVELR